ncbi:L-serine ammonia-lyase [Salinarimonas ramus]|uniref:L-serine dehydratase n=1 Tax=Salinarimonas ramus TaxID=690164 RepID=A0A917QBY6_9HYPH|nr:L-serine ammonia-lyase [Salinarimonas ramus]GGK42486.1 L-serine dehydratase [Salinarimonas ramus]
MISVFELFKIGIGPSSSHTVGPMVAAGRFLGDMRELRSAPARIVVSLHGSLAFTGRGHASDLAICLGLLGERPDRIDPDAVPSLVAGLERDRAVRVGEWEVAFDPAADLVLDVTEMLPGHTNGMRFRVLDEAGEAVLTRVYYSIGGGFVIGEADETRDAPIDVVAPVPFDSADELVALCGRRGTTIAAIQLENEEALRSRAEIDAGLDRIAEAMLACIERGLATGGTLPGRLKVRRRAKDLHARLEAGMRANTRSPSEVMDRVSTFAIAVNEENAAGGRVVTAPTNGAAGIVPAVLRYLREICGETAPETTRTFLLTAAAIGGLIKRKASISGAEVGCQGEVGSAASMAAAGLAAALGATPEQVENAAEIAMEHHLGMTCDPVGGLVQIPCIERNAFGAVKAIAAASLAMHGDGVHHVSLDCVIETMRQTGLDMQSKYKETSQGGLAVNVAEC